MSLEPDLTPELVAAPPAPPRPTWHNKLLRVCFALFSLEIGMFLVLFPWLDTWNMNYLQGLNPSLEAFWDNSFFRGALSGLGLVNVYIAFLEMFRLLRRAR